MISWGIIGCGNVTEVKSGPAFNKVPSSRLVAVMRRNLEKARDYALRHSVEKYYDDADALIADPGVSAVYIATPPSSHKDYALRCLAAGKPVYLEKPMAMNADQAFEIAEAVRTSAVKLSVAHYRRQQPIFLKLKKLLTEGAIGKIKKIKLRMIQPAASEIIAASEENWRLNPAISGGGLFHDLAPHQLDLMLYFFGEPVEVSGSGGFEKISGEMSWEDGKRFEGHWDFAASEREDSLVITGDDGVISCSVFGAEPLRLNDEIFQFDALQHVQQPMIEAVVNYYEGKSPNPCSAEEGRRVMEMIDAIS